jgi:hypothetical protein
MDTPTEANVRFADFMLQVLDTRHLWVLRSDEGYAQWSSEDGVCFPIWSQQQMAERAALRSLPGYQPEQLALDVFRDSVLPKLRDKKFWLGVNLTDEMCGIEIPCEQFEKEIASRVV